MRLDAFRRTKTYDLLAAVPLILWYGLGVYGQIPNLFHETLSAQLTAQNIRAVLHVLALLTSFAFLGLLVVLLILRPPPAARARGLAPRAVALAHSFLGVGYLWIGTGEPSLAVTIVSWLLSLAGTAGAIHAALWLRGGFSIMPEARKLVTRGAYAHIRHPIYLAEAIGTLGLALQFRQPWSAALFLATLPLLLLRMNYEEQVLGEAFPEYRAYAARTARLIPGVY